VTSLNDFTIKLKEWNQGFWQYFLSEIKVLAILEGYSEGLKWWKESILA